RNHASNMRVFQHQGVMLFRRRSGRAHIAAVRLRPPRHRRRKLPQAQVVGLARIVTDGGGDAVEASEPDFSSGEGFFGLASPGDSPRSSSSDPQSAAMTTPWASGTNGRTGRSSNPVLIS